MKRLLLFVLLLTLPTLAQVTPPAPAAPTVGFSGTIGPGARAPLLNYGAITMTDADHTLINPEFRAIVLRFQGALTQDRRVFAPNNIFGYVYTVQNATSGNHAIIFTPGTTAGVATGSGVSIPDGSTALVMYDGTNYVPVGGGGSVGPGPGPGGGGGGMALLFSNTATGSLAIATGPLPLTGTDCSGNTCTMITPPVDGMYMFQAEIIQTTPASGCTGTGGVGALELEFTQPDTNIAYSVRLAVTKINAQNAMNNNFSYASNVPNGNTAHDVSIPLTFYAKANAAITYKMTVLTASTCATVNQFIVRPALWGPTGAGELAARQTKAAAGRQMQGRSGEVSLVYSDTTTFSPSATASSYLQIPHDYCSNFVSNRWTCTMTTPPVDGAYRLEVEVIQLTPGAGCTTSDSAIRYLLYYTQPDNNYDFEPGGLNLGFRTMAAQQTLLNGIIAGAAEPPNGAGTNWVSMPLTFRAKGGATIRFGLYQHVGSACTTQPTLILRPQLYSLGY